MSALTGYSKWTKGLVLIVLFCSLTSSSFELKSYLNSKLKALELLTYQPEKLKNSAKVITLARQFKLPIAYRFTALIAEQGSAKQLAWLSKAAISDNWSANYLGSYYLFQHLDSASMASKGRLLGLAELEQLGQSKVQEKALNWLQHAYDRGEQSAAPLLATAQVISGNKSRALELLIIAIFGANQSEILPFKAAFTGENYATNFAFETKLAFELAIDLGQVATIQRLQPILTQVAYNDISALKLLLAGYQFSIFEQHDVTQGSIPVCEFPIQLYATSLAALERATKLSNSVQGAAHYNDHFCFLPPRYLPINELDCQLKQNSPIICNEAKLEVSKFVKVAGKMTYLGFIVPQGVANVSNGYIYLDEQDTIDEFKHELLHLLGFVDEFELPIGHSFCYQDEGWVATNLYLTARPQAPEAVLPSGLTWKRAKTCQPDKYIYKQRYLLCHNLVQRIAKMKYAWRPATEKTKLEHFELSLPASYWQLMEYHGMRFSMKLNREPQR